MKQPLPEDLLEVIGCEIAARPQAPGIDELAPLARSVARSAGAIEVAFEADALPSVEEFAAAERQCCAGIGWDVGPGPPVTLRIAANEAALDVIEQLWNSNVSSSIYKEVRQ